MNCVLVENVKWWLVWWLVAQAVLLLVAGAIVKLSDKQKWRTGAALVCVLCSPLACLVLVLFVLKESTRAAPIWILLSVFQIGVCVMLAKQHLSQVKKDASKYLHNLFELNDDKEYEFSVEGESSFVVIVWGIYGLAALLGSVFNYFAIAEAWKPETFIFKNNEGFIAALALLIIVISGAAVPIYTDLAKQVRQQIETFQLQISELNRAVTNISQHADPLWTHMQSVSSAAIRTWSEGLRPEDVGQASYDLLLKPFLIIEDQKHKLPDRITFDRIPDEYFLSYQKINYPFNTGRILSELAGFKENYLETPDLEKSKMRIRENSMFKSKETGELEKDEVKEEKDEEISIDDRQLRSRRLRYLGWLAQGELGILFSKSTTDFPNWFAPTRYMEYPLSIIDKPENPDDTTRSLIFQGDSLQLVPATEDWMVAVLNSPSDLEKSEKINEFAGEFSSRATRHIKRWNDVVSSKLVAICDPLDLDIAVFADDMYLLEQLASQGIYDKPYSVGVNARFLYYGFWLNAVSEPKTAVAKILAILKKPEADETVIDVRKELNEIRELVANFVATLTVCENRDPISKQPYLSGFPKAQVLIHWKLLVNYLHFSNIWAKDRGLDKQIQAWLVAQIDSPQSDTIPKLDKLDPKHRNFLCWLVRVLGSDEEKEDLDGKLDSDLLILAFCLISPYFKNQYGQKELQKVNRKLLSDEKSETQFQEIISRVNKYCIDENNAEDLKETFFVGNDSSTKSEAPTNYNRWLTMFKERKITKQGSQNLTEEFLLLTLADHKSALFNWLRAARSVETRRLVQRFQKNLEKFKLEDMTRQLGIEVIPSRHDYLIYLQKYLGVSGHQKSMRLRSIYDLQPTEAEKAEKEAKKSNNENKMKIYRSYVEIIKHLDISNSFRKDAGLSEQIQAWLVAQIDSQQSDTIPKLDGLYKKHRNFLCWLVRVLGSDEEKEKNLKNDSDLLILAFGSDEEKEKNLKNDSDLLILAFCLISPYFKNQYGQKELQKVNCELLSDEKSETQFQEIISRVNKYCKDENNAEDLKETFFGGNDSSTKSEAPTNYNRWLEKFKEKHQKEQSDNDNQ